MNNCGGKKSCKYYKVCGNTENCKHCTGYEKVKKSKTGKAKKGGR